MDVQVKVRTATLKKAGTGTPQIELEVYVGSKGRLQGELIRGYFSLTPKAMPYTVEQLKLCGWKGDLRNLQTCTLNVVRATIEEREDENGRTRLRVDRIWPLVRTVDPEQALVDSEIDRLQELIGKPAMQPREPGSDDDAGDFAPMAAYGTDS